MKLFQTRPDLVVKNLVFLFAVSYFYFSFCHLVLPFGIYLHQVFIIFSPSLFYWTEQVKLLHCSLKQLALYYLEQPVIPSPYVFLLKQIILECA